MKDETLLINLGRDAEQHAGMVNTPVYQTSTIIFPTLKAYKAAEKGKGHYKQSQGGTASDQSYGLGGTPTVFALQEALAKLEGGEGCILFPSGLAALSITLLSFLEQGDHLLVPDSVYGPTRRFCNKELKRFGIEATFYDPLIGAGIEKLFKKNTKLVFVESPGSLTFEVQDIPAIAKVAHKKNALVVLDNSWATPLFFKPFEHGVDVSIQAVTKYIGGHSDVLMGAAIANGKHFETLKRRFRHYGTGASPEDCAQVLKGLRTLSVRMERHYKNAMKVALWLENQKRISRVIYPPLIADKGYKLWKRDFTGACGLFTAIFDKHYPESKIEAFVDGLDLFGIGASWGGYESLALPVNPAEIRTATKWKAEGSAIRFHIGLENADDLIADLAKAFKRLA